MKGAFLGRLSVRCLAHERGRLLANLMLPDGAERQPEDWTIFFLNQTPFNTIAPVLALDTPGARTSLIEDEDGKPQLLYVLNLVRTKLDKTVRRCVIRSFATDYALTMSQRSHRQGHGYMHATLIY